MKPRWRLVIIAVVTVVLVLSVTGAALAATSEETVDTANATPVLRPHVAQHLVVLREQEKLARDVYAILYAKWNQPVFRTFGASAARDMASVKVILDRYGIEDPVGSNPPGVFTSERLQRAYEELVAAGAKSLTEAYKVGVVMERRLIANLRDLLGDTDRPDITLMARNLLVHSQNHLAVFHRLLNQ